MPALAKRQSGSKVLECGLLGMVISDCAKLSYFKDMERLNLRSKRFPL